MKRPCCFVAVLLTLIIAASDALAQNDARTDLLKSCASLETPGDVPECKKVMIQMMCQYSSGECEWRDHPDKRVYGAFWNGIRKVLGSDR
jgi:hypothetical protein